MRHWPAGERQKTIVNREEVMVGHGTLSLVRIRLVLSVLSPIRNNGDNAIKCVRCTKCILRWAAGSKPYKPFTLRTMIMSTFTGQKCVTVLPLSRMSTAILRYGKAASLAQSRPWSMRSTARLASLLCDCNSDHTFLLSSSTNTDCSAEQSKSQRSGEPSLVGTTRAMPLQSKRSGDQHCIHQEQPPSAGCYAHVQRMGTKNF